MVRLSSKNVVRTGLLFLATLSLARADLQAFHETLDEAYKRTVKNTWEGYILTNKLNINPSTIEANAFPKGEVYRKIKDYTNQEKGTEDAKNSLEKLSKSTESVKTAIDHACPKILELAGSKAMSCGNIIENFQNTYKDDDIIARFRALAVSPPETTTDKLQVMESLTNIHYELTKGMAQAVQERKSTSSAGIGSSPQEYDEDDDGESDNENNAHMDVDDAEGDLDDDDPMNAGPLGTAGDQWPNHVLVEGMGATNLGSVGSGPGFIPTGYTGNFPMSGGTSDSDIPGPLDGQAQHGNFLSGMSYDSTLDQSSPGPESLQQGIPYHHSNPAGQDPHNLNPMSGFIPGVADPMSQRNLYGLPNVEPQSSSQQTTGEYTNEEGPLVGNRPPVANEPGKYYSMTGNAVPQPPSLNPIKYLVESDSQEVQSVFNGLGVAQFMHKWNNLMKRDRFSIYQKLSQEQQELLARSYAHVALSSALQRGEFSVS
ncbi:hypothetical protein IWQ61_001635 [Dispira simplex]|nr:hypothetical protein IWQ61_001635 [Dispira simplex]